MNWLIASLAAVESFKEAFTSPVSETDTRTAFVIWLIVFGLLSSSVAALWLTWILYQDNKRYGQTARRLGRWLGLKRHDVRLLTVVAAHADLPSATCLLISRGCFDAAAERVTIRREQRQHLRDIRERIFQA